MCVGWWYAISICRLAGWCVWLVGVFVSVLVGVLVGGVLLDVLGGGEVGGEVGGVLLDVSVLERVGWYPVLHLMNVLPPFTYTHTQCTQPL